MHCGIYYHNFEWRNVKNLHSSPLHRLQPLSQALRALWLEFQQKYPNVPPSRLWGAVREDFEDFEAIVTQDLELDLLAQEDAELLSLFFNGHSDFAVEAIMEQQEKIRLRVRLKQ